MVGPVLSFGVIVGTSGVLVSIGTRRWISVSGRIENMTGVEGKTGMADAYMELLPSDHN